MVRFLASLAMMHALALFHEMSRFETVHANSIRFQCTNFLIV